MTGATFPPRRSRHDRYCLIAAAGLILALAAEACSVGLLGLSGWFIASSAVAGAAAYGMFSYLDPSGGVRAFALGRIITTYASRLALHSAALRKITAARLAFYDRIVAEASAHGSWAGQSLDRVLADADTDGMALLQATAPVVTAACMTVGGCAAIIIAGYPLPAAIVAMAAAACAALGAAAARHADRASKARAALRTELVTALEAWPEMASLGAAAQLAGRTTRQLNAVGDSLGVRAAAQARTAGAARAMSATAVALTAGAAAGQGAGAPALVFVTLTAVGVMANAGQLISAAEARVLARHAARRLADGDDAQPPPPSPGVEFRAAFDGHMLTVDACRLPGRPVRQIGFTVTAGQTLVVTGASGTGKTTLLNAIAAATSQPGRHPGTVTSVLADDYLFTGTVGSNIRLASPLTSGSDIDDLLAVLLLDRSAIGPATAVGDGGRDLSGGEQRRLHIARALAARPDVLLIDEPATGLDPPTANQVLAAARQRLPRAVLILAMHELPADTSVLGPDWAALSLDQDLPGHRRLVPAGQAVGELPGEEVLLAAAAPVARVPQHVHREAARRASDESAADRTERRVGGLSAEVVKGAHRYDPGLVQDCPPITGP